VLPASAENISYEVYLRLVKKLTNRQTRECDRIPLCGRKIGKRFRVCWRKSDFLGLVG
jgi:hypothetical protein